MQKSKLSYTVELYITRWFANFVKISVHPFYINQWLKEKKNLKY